jgi:predicted ATPase
MLRPLTAAELSDGTLRYLLWVAALLSPRPAELTVLNEPEASLHPELLPALAALIARASEVSQILVVTHAAALVNALQDQAEPALLQLAKQDGQTVVEGQGLLDEPPWQWPDRG